MSNHDAGSDAHCSVVNIEQNYVLRILIQGKVILKKEENMTQMLWKKAGSGTAHYAGGLLLEINIFVIVLC